MADSSTVDWIIERSKRYPLLTPTEEIELARDVQAWLPIRYKDNLSKEEKSIARRGKRAYDRFFLCNVRLVVMMANRYTKRGGSLMAEDLIQEGILGLQSAIIKFDPARGYKFSTYAFNWVRQAICRAINSYGKTIRIPEAAYRVLRLASEFVTEYENAHGHKPPLSKVAASVHVQEITLRSYMRHQSLVCSLDEQVKGNGNSKDRMTILEMIADEISEPSVISEVDNVIETMLEVVSTLKEDDQQIIMRRYFKADPDPYRIIAEECGVSRERIRQRHDQAMRYLKVKISSTVKPADIQALQCA